MAKHGRTPFLGRERGFLFMDQAMSQEIDSNKKGTGGSMKLFCSIGIVVAALMISGCADNKTSELEQKLSGVETRINEMQSTVDYQRTKMARYQVEKDRYSKVYLDTSSKGFQRLDTN